MRTHLYNSLMQKFGGKEKGVCSVNLLSAQNKLESQCHEHFGWNLCVQTMNIGTSEEMDVIFLLVIITTPSMFNILLQAFLSNETFFIIKFICANIPWDYTHFHKNLCTEVQNFTGISLQLAFISEGDFIADS